MKPKTFDELNGAIRRHFGRGTVTNCFLNRDALEAEIAAGTLETDENDAVLLLYRERGGYRLLNFYLNAGTDGAELPEIPGGTVLEIPMRERDAGLREAADTFRRAGFDDRFTRKRLIRREGEEYAVSPAVSAAKAEDSEAVAAIFAECFDPETGCLPKDPSAELPRILVYRDGAHPAGLLHYTVTGTGSELRHLAVLPEYWGRGIAGALTESYLALVPGKSTVWVRDGYLPAQAVYEKRGYLPDGMTSAVLKKR